MQHLNMNFTSLHIANYFITKEPYIRHLKLQKLLYCAYGWYLVKFDGERLVQEQPYAWERGPVFPSLYKELKSAAKRSGRKNRQFYDIPVSSRDNRYGPPPIVSPYQEETASLRTFLDWVSDRYEEYTGVQMVPLTHHEGSPWFIVASKYDFDIPSGVVIKDELIKAEFGRFIKEPADN